MYVCIYYLSIIYIYPLSLSSIYLSSGICVVIYHLLCISLSHLSMYVFGTEVELRPLCVKPSDADPHSQSLPSVYYDDDDDDGSYSPSRP